ncbi:LOW QUALITY PROTEIN: hypothetical protein IFM46972_03590 [Aspergillus udagawae]|uniref:Uncharacterized protein n=1 Tax=Aspergillus udagawae TaxID=91492 RepID=A0A8H3RP22_9EURO|nr:LOW QUALITY PROTEIN: hypothetical protein IFM46972_03590 [Aspergillus udagawae]
MPQKPTLWRRSEHQCDVVIGKCSVTKDAKSVSACGDGWQSKEGQSGIHHSTFYTREYHKYEKKDYEQQLCVGARNSQQTEVTAEGL